MSFKRAFFTVGGFTLLSRFVGFIRDVVAAQILGAGMAADAFFVALRLPNLFRRLFAEGAFTISFIPLFTSALKDGKAEAQKFAEEALAGLLAALLIFSLFMMIFMPQVMHIITPGYAKDAAKFAFAVQLSQITFPYLMLISLSALLGSILNALGRFGPYAAAPIAFNIVQLIALFGWNAHDVTAAKAQAWAITISGVVQLLWLAISLRRAGWTLRLRWPHLTPRLKRLLVLIGPGALGAGVMQINIFIDMVLASLLPAGAVSYLSYADRLYQLPVGVIGIAIGTALLPTLSHTVREATPEVAHAEQNRAIEFGLFLGMPAAVGLAVLANPIINVLYQRGAFTAEVTAAVAWALAAYAIAIPAYMISKVVTVAFYAREDTKTPFSISMRTVWMNTIASYGLIVLLQYWGFAHIAHAGIALSTALTAWLNVALLLLTLKKRGHFVADSFLRHRVKFILLSALAMAGVLWGLRLLLSHLFLLDFWVKAPTLAGMIAVGAGAYFTLAHLTGAQRLDLVLTRLKRRRRDKGVDAPMPPMPE